MPSAPAPFVSFNDYLDANSGSLGQERSQLLGSTDADVSKLGPDTEAAKTAAFGQGADAARASWSAQRAAGQAPGSKPLTSSEQYKAPTDFSVNMTSLPGQEQFATDKAKAETDINALQQGGLGMGKSAFEAGMIGADTGFRDQAAGKQKGLQDSINSYLDAVRASGQAGVSSFTPPPIQGTKVVPDNIGGTGQPEPNMGPVMKPTHHTVQTINGKPGQGDEEQLP